MMIEAKHQFLRPRSLPTTGWPRRSDFLAANSGRHSLLWALVGLAVLGVTGCRSVNVEGVRQRAEAGDPKAQCELADMYYKGRGLPKDPAEAARWLRKAADQGNALAQYNLGVSYANGDGVAKDEAEAAKWYRKAGDQG